VDDVHYYFLAMSIPDSPHSARTPKRERAPRRGPRLRGAVRSALVEAGLVLARTGGPDAVVLREVTRMVGVVPNAAYRHFADRDALLAAVREAAIGELARRMSDGMAAVRAGSHTPRGARLRMGAVGRAYLDFARTEPGLFDTAFSSPAQGLRAPSGGESDRAEPPLAGAPPRPLDYVRAALDNLVAAGLLGPARRPNLEYPTWATVHGLAVLLRGPLRALSDHQKARLETQTLAFIEASLS
jgi:AcrR family transcriptional regulator